MSQPIQLMYEYTKNLKVLYVEDDLNLINITKELFENYFLSLDIAYDGQEGLEKYNTFYKDNNIHYDLVITDINMPKLNGIEMSKEIYKLNSLQSILITSAYNDSEYLCEAIDIGISGFITKPIKNKTIVDVLLKVSRAIYDHKFVEEHVGQVELLYMQIDEKNKHLELQNKELLRKNKELEKSFRMLDTMVHKEQLSHPKQEDENILQSNEESIYLQEQIEHLISDDLQELVEIHENIDNIIIEIINSVDSINMHDLLVLAEEFKKYASVLSLYNFFDALSHAMKDFSYTLKNNPLPENEETTQNIFMLLESFIYVLGKWQDDLSSGDESKINSLDASIISDMDTITNMWTQKEELVTDEDLDDIFDF